MRVYFIRHGQTEFHENSRAGEKKFQLPNTPLNETGYQDAAKTGQRLLSIPIDIIITSTYKRAFQTAEEIIKIKPTPFIQSDLFIERKMPSSFQGKDITDPEIVPIHEEIRKHFYEPTWHYAGEENFADIFSRAKDAIEFIRLQNKRYVAVVTHGYFLTVLIFYLIFGKDIEHQTFRKFRDHTTNTTAGITICELQNGIWKLITWNDFAHLDTSTKN